MEQWKDLWFSKYYQVSTYGRIKSKKRLVRFIQHNTGSEQYRLKEEKILSISKCKGYNVINIQGKTYRVCRLVSESFIQMQVGKGQVNHIDGNKANDNIENLEWCTAKENMQHAIKNGLWRSNPEKSRKKVECILTGEIFNSIKEAANNRGVDPSNISRALNGTYKNTHNLKYA